MLRNFPFLLIGLLLAAGPTSSLLGCGGDEFGTDDPDARSERDGAGDGHQGNDGPASGGRGGSAGVGGSGGTAGVSTTGGSGGTGAGGTGANAGAGGKDASTNNDAASDVAFSDASDARLDDGPRPGTEAGRGGDAPTLDADGTTFTDAKDADSDNSATDSSRDTSASPDTTEAGQDVGCSEPVTYYKDEDGDGFGTDQGTTISCTWPGNKWSVLGGDCRDDLANVKPFTMGSPNPPQYSGTGYADNSKPQGVSFDYDCTGAEEADPSNSYGNEPDCAGLLNCTGVGYVAVNPARTGAGIDPRCGSTTLKRCNGNILNCNSTVEVTTDPYRCR